MRKITTAIFLLLICTDGIFADYTKSNICQNQTNAFDCKNTAGCYWSNEACTQCPANMFCPAGRDDVTKYGTCDPSIDNDTDTNIDMTLESEYINLITTTAPFSHIKDSDYQGSTGPESCPVTITCPTGSGLVWNATTTQNISCQSCSLKDNEENRGYFNKKDAISFKITDFTKETDHDYSGCDQCGANSSLVDVTTGCNCNDHYHIINQTNNDSNENDATDCIADYYLVNIYSDCADDTNTIVTNNTNQQYVTHDIDSWQDYGQNDNNSDRVHSTISEAIKESNLQLTKNGYHLTGTGDTIYTTPSNWKIDSTDATTDTLNNPITKQENKNKTYTVCPMWTANTFYIEYKPGTPAENVTIENMPSRNTTCTYNKPCEISTTTPTANNGYVFMGWKITSGNHTDSFDSNTKYQPEDDFTNATTEHNGTIVLTAQWQLCPAGYYACENNSGTLIGCKCPAGSTSAPGATSKKNCFINNDTQFCDTNGQSCFKLNICTQIDGVWDNCPGHTDDTATCSAKQEINVSAQQ